jgi:hypothetical protein
MDSATEEENSLSQEEAVRRVSALLLERLES